MTPTLPALRDWPSPPLAYTFTSDAICCAASALLSRQCDSTADLPCPLLSSPDPVYRTQQFPGERGHRPDPEDHGGVAESLHGVCVFIIVIIIYMQYICIENIYSICLYIYIYTHMKIYTHIHTYCFVDCISICSCGYTHIICVFIIKVGF